MPALKAPKCSEKVKSYLCTTMSNNCPNHLMICTVHKELVKELNLKQVTNDFGYSREPLIHLGPLFHIAVIDVDEILSLVLVISHQNSSIFSVELGPCLKN